MKNEERTTRQATIKKLLTAYFLFFFFAIFLHLGFIDNIIWCSSDINVSNNFLENFFEIFLKILRA